MGMVVAGAVNFCRGAETSLGLRFGSTAPGAPNQLVGPKEAVQAAPSHALSLPPDRLEQRQGLGLPWHPPLSTREGIAFAQRAVPEPSGRKQPKRGLLCLLLPGAESTHVAKKERSGQTQG